MDKKLIMVNGTMGVGKTTICKELLADTENAIWLDGDWCWMMNPFVVNEENKRMVENNIIYQLNQFIENPHIEYIIFNWVMHDEGIIRGITDRLRRDIDFDTVCITLMCSEDELKRRIISDIRDGKREEGSLEKSVKRLKMYRNMNTHKVDTTNKAMNQIIDEIKELIQR